MCMTFAVASDLSEESQSRVFCPKLKELSWTDSAVTLANCNASAAAEQSPVPSKLLNDIK